MNNITWWQLALVFGAYTIIPLWLGWSISFPKSEHGPNGIIFFTVMWVLFFLIGTLLKYQLGSK